METIFEEETDRPELVSVLSLFCCPHFEQPLVLVCLLCCFCLRKAIVSCGFVPGVLFLRVFEQQDLVCFRNFIRKCNEVKRAYTDHYQH